MRAALFSVFILRVAGPAGTPRADDDPRAAAGDHYARGTELAQQGLYEAALEQFNAAYAASPHFAVLYNIGQAQMALGRPLEAIEALSKYLRDGADQVPLSRREQVQAQIGLLESRLAELSITSNRVGAVIRVDGRDVGRTPLFQPIRLAAGLHTVTASLVNDAQPITREISLRESERQTLELTFAGVSPAPGPVGSISEGGPGSAQPSELLLAAAPVKPPEPWYFRGKTMRRMAYVLAGVGVLSVGAAVGIYLAKRGQYQDWQAGNVALQGDAMGSAAYMAQATSNNALAGSLGSANDAIIGLSVAGGALVAAGVTLFLVDRAHRRVPSQFSFGVGERSASAGWSWTW
jgi:tetratricopeptide (TPR) repeat protein